MSVHEIPTTPLSPNSKAHEQQGGQITYHAVGDNGVSIGSQQQRDRGEERGEGRGEERRHVEGDTPWNARLTGRGKPTSEVIVGDGAKRRGTTGDRGA